MHALSELILGADGWEALRLCDHEGLDQDDAAVRMGVSRATIGRILERARRTVARALVDGCALTIGVPAAAVRACSACSGTWPGSTSLAACPSCGCHRTHLLITPEP